MRGRAWLAAWILWIGLSTPAWTLAQPRTEIFAWAASDGAIAYRLYQCRQACWNQNDVRRAWERAVEGSVPRFVVAIPDRRTFWMAATVYPDREIFRWNVVWYTVPGPSFVTVPPP